MAEAVLTDPVQAKFQGVIIPHHPRTDEISAVVVAERILNNPLTEIRFWGHPECSWSQIDEFANQGFLPIEIGDTSYKIVGTRSVVEATASILGYGRDNLKPGEHKLVEMFARRNGLGPNSKDDGGYMNQFYMSLPRILKDLYDLPGYDELDLISRFKDVVHTFLNYENRPENSAPVTIKSAFLDLIFQVEKCQMAPFTPGRYLRDLCYRDEPVDQVREKVSFWITAWNRFQSEFAKAQHEWPRADKLRFSFNGLDAAAIETDEKFFPKVCFGKEQAGRVDLLVIKSSGTGHTAVLTRRKDSLALYNELARLEPNRWYRHEPTGNLLNGGSEFPQVTPTSLTLSELAGLVAKFPPR